MHHYYKKPKNIKLRDDCEIQVRRIHGEILSDGTVHLQNGRLLHFKFIHLKDKKYDYILKGISLKVDRKNWAFMVSIPFDKEEIDAPHIELFAKENSMDYQHLCKKLTYYQRVVIRCEMIKYLPLKIHPRGFLL